MIEMVRDDDGNFVPAECCTYTNPATSGGESQVDDVDLPCLECAHDCEKCVMQRIMNEYAALTGQDKAMPGEGTRENIISEADMLKGNIFRICVTDSGEELAEMYQWASRRLANLFLWNLQRIRNAEKSEE